MRGAQMLDDQLAITALRGEPAAHDRAAARIVLVEDEIVDELLRPRHRKIRQRERIEPRLIGPQLAWLFYLARRDVLDVAARRGAFVEPRRAARLRKQLEIDLAHR